jgi:hypothetical protein
VVYQRIDHAVLNTAQEWDIADTDVLDLGLLWVDELILGASQFNHVSYLDTLNI